MDNTYRPLSENDEDTEPASTEVKVESWSDFRKGLEEQHGVEHYDLSLDEAANETTRHRREVPTPENSADRPIVVHKLAGDGPKSLREATEDLSFSRGLAQRQELLASGYSEQEVERLGIDKMEAALRGDPLAEPPAEFKDEDRWGEAQRGELSASEAADKITAWRQQQAAERAQELAELQGEQEQRQQEYEQPQPQPEQPKPQQPDAVQRERTELALERARLSALRQMDGVEVNLRQSYDRLVKTVLEDFPGLQNGAPTQAELDHLKQNAPARFEQLAVADRALREHQSQIAQLTQQRERHEQQHSQAIQQQRAAFRANQDADFERRAEKIVGEAWKQGSREMQNAAIKTLESAGLTRQQITELWNGDASIDMHSAVLQEVLLKASMYDAAREKAQTIRQSGLPSVIRPGVGNFRGSGDSGVSELRARLKSAKGNQGIRLGAELLKAQRAAKRV